MVESDLRGFRGSVPQVAQDGAWLACIECGHESAPFEAALYRCPACQGLLEVRYDEYRRFSDFTGRGVWRYRSALPVAHGVSLTEGGTPLYSLSRVAETIGVADLRVKYEGLNPTGSFKDRGMTVGVRVAQRLDVDRLACASTGNTSAALACYGARAGMPVVVLLPAGNVAAGKLAQAGIHDARILEVEGNFDDCLRIVADLADREEVYLLNSLNPYRLEGQKTIGFEILEQSYEASGQYPDRIVLPVGNAGNTAALFKAFRELVTSGAIDTEDVPTLTGVQAEGAAPVVEAITNEWDSIRPWDDVETRATAIRIGDPVNAPKALPAIRATGGTAVSVSDSEITNAQRLLASHGIGVEPASAASVAGLQQLVATGRVRANEHVVCLTTGHLLKDPDAAAAAGSEPESVPDSVDAVLEALSGPGNRGN